MSQFKSQASLVFRKARNQRNVSGVSNNGFVPQYTLEALFAEKLYFSARNP